MGAGWKDMPLYDYLTFVRKQAIGRDLELDSDFSHRYARDYTSVNRLMNL